MMGEENRRTNKLDAFGPFPPRVDYTATTVSLAMPSSPLRPPKAAHQDLGIG
jgi:hypothetical protein